jgi:hypothetical protein
VIDLNASGSSAQRLTTLDGIVWTPWGTVLLPKTATLCLPWIIGAIRGLLYELKLDKKDPTKAESIKVRPMLGSVSHEGIEFDSEGNVYVIDENGPGAIFKFIPKKYGDLSDGQLYALKLDDSSNPDRVGPAEWWPRHESGADGRARRRREHRRHRLRPS